MLLIFLCFDSHLLFLHRLVSLLLFFFFFLLYNGRNSVGHSETQKYDIIENENVKRHWTYATNSIKKFITISEMRNDKRKKKKQKQSKIIDCDKKKCKTVLWNDLCCRFSAVIGAIVSAATSGRSHGGGGGGGGGYGHGGHSYAAPTRTKTIILKKGMPFSFAFDVYLNVSVFGITVE